MNRFGIAFLGDKWSEGKLFGMAYAFEQRTKVRTKFKLRVSAKTELKDIIKNP
jgi:amidase